MQAPRDPELPFFAYGLFRRGQLGFLRLRDFVERAMDGSIQGAVFERDGLPILDPTSEHSAVDGSVFWFKRGVADDAYKSIAELEPDAQYSWDVREVRAHRQVFRANVLVGKRPRDGSIELEDPWDGRTDLLFTVALRQANVTLYVRGDRIGLTNWLGVHKEVAVSDVDAIVMCSVLLPRRQQPLPLVMAVSKSGRCLFSLPGADELRVTGITRLASAAGLELRGSWTDTSSLAGLEARYPGSTPRASGFFVWLLTRRSLTSAIAIVATILVFIGLVVLRTTGH